MVTLDLIVLDQDIDFTEKSAYFEIFFQGYYSATDSENWTPELQKALNFDRKSAIQVDNGKLC